MTSSQKHLHTKLMPVCFGFSRLFARLWLWFWTVEINTNVGTSWADVHGAGTRDDSEIVCVGALINLTISFAVFWLHFFISSMVSSMLISQCGEKCIVIWNRWKNTSKPRSVSHWMPLTGNSNVISTAEIIRISRTEFVYDKRACDCKIWLIFMFLAVKNSLC